MITFEPLPEVGTMKVCGMCHFVITLERIPSGWYYWVADKDPLDGRRHCLGGSGPGTVEMPPLRTLHVPDQVWEGHPPRLTKTWAWRYTPEGEARGQW